MTVYSIGDRVEVLWLKKVYPAKVIKLHSSGEVDVVYDINNNVGVFLTAKEHGLKLCPEKGGERERETMPSSQQAKVRLRCVKVGSIMSGFISIHQGWRHLPFLKH